MNRRNFLYEIVVISFVIVICTLPGCGDTKYASPFKPSEDDTTVFSGSVVDENGDPVVGLALAIQPNEADDARKSQMPDTRLEVKTDASGHFSLMDIRPGSWRLSVIHYIDTDTEPTYGILSVKIGEISLKPAFDLHTLSPFNGTAFSITPGVHVEDVEIVVQRRMRIGTTIVLTDGTPLANKEVSLNIETRDLEGDGRGKLWGPVRTDARGYFERYVNRIGFYTVSVEYDGVSAMSSEFLLNAGERREDLILKLPNDRR